jgi:glycosyl transferase family 25
MWEFVDRIVYINLKKRTDRNDRIIEEILPKFGGHEVRRFEAIENINGGIGCYMSHILVLTEAIQDNVKNILILEDDIIWNKFEENYEKLKDLVNQPYDVIMLGGTAVQAQGNKVISANCSHAYLVNNHYLYKLLDIFKQGLNSLTQNPNSYYYNALDQFWKQSQRSDNWLILQPCMLYQNYGYSDIEHTYKPIDTKQSF